MRDRTIRPCGLRSGWPSADRPPPVDAAGAAHARLVVAAWVGAWVRRPSTQGSNFDKCSVSQHEKVLAEERQERTHHDVRHANLRCSARCCQLWTYTSSSLYRCSPPPPPPLRRFPLPRPRPPPRLPPPPPRPPRPQPRRLLASARSARPAAIGKPGCITIVSRSPAKNVSQKSGV